MPMLQPIRAELAHNSKPAAYKTQIAKSPDVSLGFGVVAERTGLEPATPCVTGRYSNRLNYRSAVFPWERGEYYGLPPNSSTLFLTF